MGTVFMSALYLIAKHVPDVFRNEPKNVGVIVWSESGTAAKFIGADQCGNVDGRKVPDWISSKSAYKQWVAFWYSSISKSEMEFIGERKIARVGSPEFVEALRTANKESFFLSEAGHILDSITEADFPGLLNQLFSSFIGQEAQIVEEVNASEVVKEECEKIIRQTPLYESKNFIKGDVIQCPVGKTVEAMEFSYSLRNGGIKWLGQRVVLHKYGKALSDGVDAVLWRFAQVVKEGFIPSKDAAAAFVYPTEDQLKDNQIKKKIDVLEEVSVVLDLRDTDNVKRRLEQISASDEDHT